MPLENKIITSMKSFFKKDVEIGVGILNFNNSEDTIGCHKSIISSVSIPQVVVILDNASRPSEKIKLMKYVEQAGKLLDSQRDKSLFHPSLRSGSQRDKSLFHPSLRSGSQRDKSLFHPSLRSGNQHLKFNRFLPNFDLYVYEIEEVKETSSLLPPRSARELKHFLILVQLKKNIGFCSGNNLIVRILNLLAIKYVLILNNDTEVFPKSIEQLLNTIKETRATAVSPLIYDKENKIWYAGGDYSWYGYKYIKRPKSYKNFYFTNVYSGCCVIFLTSEYLARGGMDDSLFIALDEPEFSRRIRAAGGKILVEPRVSILHKVGGSIGKKGSKLHDYFWVRNRILYSSLHNNFFYHLLFLTLYGFLRVARWTFYFLTRQNHRSKIEILAMKDYFSRNFGPGFLWEELNALKTESKRNYE